MSDFSNNCAKPGSQLVPAVAIPSTSCFRLTRLKPVSVLTNNIMMEHFYRRMRSVSTSCLTMANRWRNECWCKQSQEAKGNKDIENLPQPLMFANDISEILKRIEHHQVLKPSVKLAAVAMAASQSSAKPVSSAHFAKSVCRRLVSFKMQWRPSTIRNGVCITVASPFALNSKLLSPKGSIRCSQAKQVYQASSKVKRYLSWYYCASWRIRTPNSRLREYIRGVYWANMPTYASKSSLLL